MNIKALQSIFSILAVISVFWAYSFFNSHSQKLAWRSNFDFETLNAEKIESINPADVPETYRLLEIASASTNDIVPRRDDLALRFLEEATTRQRFRSINWVEMGRAHIWLGNNDKAMKCLELSDQLDPGYIDQLLSSLSAWVILGNEEKPFEILDRIASLNPDDLDEAVQSMALAGIPFSSYQNQIPFDDCSIETKLSIARILARYYPSEFDYFAKKIDYSNYSTDQKIEVMSHSVQAQYFPFARDIYHQVFVGSSTGGVSFLNSELDIDPYNKATSHLLGWHKRPDEIRRTTTWVSDINKFNGVLRVDLEPSLSETSNDIVWKAYTFMVPDDYSEISFKTNIFISNPDKVNVAVDLRTTDDNKRLNYIQTEPSVVGWQELKMENIELVDRRQLYSVWFAISRKGSSRNSNFYIMLDGIEFIESEEEL